jgi:TetR/AcrR family transcriptional regulator, regulator of mycofactocin system
VSEIKPIGRGRPPSTSHDAVGRTALQLFSQRGFDETTVEEIAAAAGVSRRTVFRYYASKNDMVWGEFEFVLDRLRSELDATGDDEPLMVALARAVIASNHYEADELPELRIRLTLISTVPALQAHSMLRYEAWRRVVAEFVARRLGLSVDDLVPQTVGWAALGASMAAFVRWVQHPDEDLAAHLRRSYDVLVSGKDVLAPRPPLG